MHSLKQWLSLNKKIMAQAIKKVYLLSCLSILTFSGALFGYWYFIDGSLINPPIVGKADPMALKTDHSVYHVGDTVSVYESFCKQRALPAEVNARFMDGMIVTMSETIKNIPVGCYGTDKPILITITDVPTGLPSGIWHLEYTVTYHINPIKDIVLYRKSKDFTIRNNVID